MYPFIFVMGLGITATIAFITFGKQRYGLACFSAFLAGYNLGVLLKLIGL